MKSQTRNYLWAVLVLSVLGIVVSTAFGLDTTTAPVIRPYYCLAGIIVSGSALLLELLK